jgi:hypothetical protein
MTLQVLMKNHTIEDLIVARTVDHTADCTVEVAVQNPSVCAGSARIAEIRMDLRTAYPMDKEYQQIT